jgi:hypothetical protein
MTYSGSVAETVPGAKRPDAFRVVCMDDLKGMKMFSLWLIASVVLLSCTPYALEPTQARAREQTIFEAEGRIRRPVAIPDDVLQILRKDERNQRSLAQGQTPADMPASWFVGSTIHLNDDGLPDLVVMAANPKLLGANLVPFWIFRNTPQGHQLVLAVNSLGLKVLKTKTNGYRDITTTEVAAAEITDTRYALKGNEYQVVRTSKERIK